MVSQNQPLDKLDVSAETGPAQSRPPSETSTVNAAFHIDVILISEGTLPFPQKLSKPEAAKLALAVQERRRSVLTQFLAQAIACNIRDHAFVGMEENRIRQLPGSLINSFDWQPTKDWPVAESPMN